jgi:hypothetical protein
MRQMAHGTWLMVIALVLVLVVAMPAIAQDDHSPIRQGATLPATCDPAAGDAYHKKFVKTSGGSEGDYTCIAINTWSQAAPGGGAASFSSLAVGSALPSNSTTVAGGPVKLSAGNYVGTDGTEASTTPVWVASTTAGEYGGTSIRLVLSGQVTVPFDATAVVANHCVTASTTGNKWHDAGATCPVGSHNVGHVVSGGAGSASYPIQIRESGIRGATNVDEVSAVQFCLDAGANDTYACNLSPAITAYVIGTMYRFKANTANTGAASINFNGVGALTIKKKAAVSPRTWRTTTFAPARGCRLSTTGPMLSASADAMGMRQLSFRP